jgi:hypothetical protein
MEHAEKVLGVTFISNDQTPEVLQPGKQPFDFPPAVSSRARAGMILVITPQRTHC